MEVNDYAERVKAAVLSGAKDTGFGLSYETREMFLRERIAELEEQLMAANHTIELNIKARSK